jgi:hypothetical protein
MPQELFCVKRDDPRSKNIAMVKFRRMTTSKIFPIEEVFHVIPAVYPHVVRIVERAGITPADFFALSFVRHFGQAMDGRYTLPTSEFHKALLKAGIFRTAGGASGFLTRLVERGLITKHSITAAARDKYFPAAQGWKTVVVLSRGGDEKLAEVATALKSLFSEASTDIPEKSLQSATHCIASVMPRLTSKLNAMWLDNDWQAFSSDPYSKTSLHSF